MPQQMDRGQWNIQIIRAISNVMNGAALLEQGEKQLRELLPLDGHRLAEVLKNPPWMCDACGKPMPFMLPDGLCMVCVSAKRERDLREKVREELLTEKKESESQGGSNTSGS